MELNRKDGFSMQVLHQVPFAVFLSQSGDTEIKVLIFLSLKTLYAMLLEHTNTLL